MQHHLSSDTERVIETFLQAGTWRQSQQIVIQHSELLSLEVDRYLHSLVVDQDNERGQHFIEEHRALLARCREVGVEQAFEEKIQVSLAARPERAGLVLMPSDLSPDLIVQLFTKMATHDKEGQLALLRQYPQLISLSTNNEEFTRVLEQYPDFREILGMPVISRSSQEHAIDFPPIFSNEMVSVNYLGGKIGQDVSALVPLIQIYERILHHKSIKKYPDFYIGILHNAAATYIQLPTGKREENLVRAIAYLEQALQIREIEKNKDIYAIVLFNLGNSYADLQRGDRGDNLLRAISYYYKTLDVWTRGTAPLQYASVQNNLGEALRLLLIDDHEQNLIRAVECYQNALTCRTPMSSPLGYAGTQLNLGIAYGQMKSGNRTEQLMKAIQCFQESLRFFTIALPLKYARAQHNMGTAYYELAILFSEESEAYLKRAETCFWEALCYRRLDVAPFEHASTQNNLGLVYRQLTARAPEYRQKAIDCFEATLHIYSLDDMPVNYRDTAHNLADMYYELKDWQQAFKYYQKALQGADRLYQSAFLPASRQAEIVTNASLYARIIVSCIQMKDNPLYARNALLYAERGKARTFLDQMGQKDIPTPVDIPRQFLERERTLIAQLRQVEQALAPMEQTDAMALQLAHQRKSLLDELAQLWDQMVQYSPAARDYVAFRRVEPLQWEDIQHLLQLLGPEVALIELHLLEDVILVFTLRHGWQAPQIIRVPISLYDLRSRYLAAYSEEILNYSSGKNRKMDPLLTDEWLRLGEKLLAPLVPMLGNTRLVYFIPHGWLHWLPLHALHVAKKPFLFQFAVAYAPSAAVLARTLEHTTQATTSNQSLVFGFTPTIEEKALFEGEASAIALQLGCTPWLGTAANSTNLQHFAPAAALLHLSCHGNFDPNNPLNSAVLLADRVFTAHEWMALPLHADLVTLSACKTGLSQVSYGDEMVGMLRALFYAGTSSTLLTLWTVNAKTTLEWMETFYSTAWPAGARDRRVALAEAFQKATLALYKKYPDPYIWAPFILVGNWL